MNQKQRIIFDHLFAGHTMRRTTNFKGKEIYKVYNNQVEPIAYITSTAFGKGRELLKRGKKGEYSLNLSSVRRQHGNTWIKRRYKTLRKCLKTPGQKQTSLATLHI